MFLGGCAPTGEPWVVPALSDLAAAGIVEIRGSEVLSLTEVPLVDGRFEGVISLGRRDDTTRLLVVMDKAALARASHRTDPERTHEARLVREPNPSCGGDKEIHEGWLSFSILDRARVFERMDGVFTELVGPEAVPAALEHFRVETPVYPEIDCGEGPRPRLVRVFPEAQALPERAEVEGAPSISSVRDLVDLVVLADGRIASINPFYLMLRRPDERYRDDPLQVRSIYAGNVSEVRPRGGLWLGSEDGAGGGELWFVSRTEAAEVYLESIRFDVEGLQERRILSRLPVEDESATDPQNQDVARMIRLPSGALAGVTLSSLGLYAPGPEGPWTPHRVGDKLTRALVEVPADELTFLVPNRASTYFWRPLATTDPVLRLAEFPLDTVSTAYARETEAGLELGVAGVRGLFARRMGPDFSGPWRSEAVELPVESNRRRACLAPVTCGRSFVAGQFWESVPVTSAGEDWLLLGVDRCAEAMMLRLRDGCPRFLEFDAELPTELTGTAARRVVQRRGRWFQLGAQGDVHEILGL